MEDRRQVYLVHLDASTLSVNLYSSQFYENDSESQGPSLRLPSLDGSAGLLDQVGLLPDALSDQGQLKDTLGDKANLNDETRSQEHVGSAPLDQQDKSTKEDGGTGQDDAASDDKENEIVLAISDYILDLLESLDIPDYD